ncbi:hypothetical protein K0M31_011322 [Melipona bicolor]|uniref:Uncharacterized protein n=1 Tax=Melipona bicolor TaxID=60889 RepID=A0AA40G9B4_9HYME|nr:hypothetical protein K0M31_011322 [Melipona bicolor]
MEHFQATLDPRKQELLEARFLGARSNVYYALWSSEHRSPGTKAMLPWATVPIVRYSVNAEIRRDDTSWTTHESIHSPRPYLDAYLDRCFENSE